MKLYRYVDTLFTDGLKVHCLEYEVLKETEKGYWIDEYSSSFNNRKKWVSKTSRKRFAHDTKIKASESFKARKNRQISIYKERLRRAQLALEYIDLIKFKSDVVNYM